MQEHMNTNNNKYKLPVPIVRYHFQIALQVLILYKIKKNS